MEIELKTITCQMGSIIPLFPDSYKTGLQGHQYSAPFLPPLKSGFFLGNGAYGRLFQIAGFTWFPELNNLLSHSPRVPLLLSLKDLDSIEIKLEIIPAHWSCAVITLSDKGSKNERLDISGPTIIKMCEETINLSWVQRFVIPDDKFILRSLLAKLALEDQYDVIFTTGGTGLGSRDITPQVTESLLDVNLPGFSQAMMAKSIAQTPNAIISRAVAGLIGQSLVINLPGSAKAVSENLTSILPGLEHALAKIHGDTTDCGN